MAMTTTELAEELELRRLRYFVGRVDYLRRHMAPGEESLLDALQGKSVMPGYWQAVDRAIDRD